MKQERNNEIDLLLRRLGRRPEGIVPDQDGHHLDADELNSYAENVLPPQARARYTEHLAQCSSCRTLVVQLSSAAGVVVAPDRAVVPEPSGFRQFLASLFSPIVLRYAIPALGLAVIAVLGLTVFRADPQRTENVARETNAPAPANEQSKPPASGLYSEGNKLDPEKSAPAATPDAGSINMAKAPTSGPAAADKISAPAADTSGANAEPPPAPKSEVQPLANTPAPSPTPAATESNERKFQVPLEKQEVQRQIEAAKERAYSPSRDESRRSTTEAAPSPASVTQSAPEAGATARPQKRTSISQSGGGREKERDDAETRTIAGRRFRKQDDVWVDTAYNSSTTPTNLTRGSEQYRALVADEPAIKNIADQLDGEIIVVWKGRPYRIR